MLNSTTFLAVYLNFLYKKNGERRRFFLPLLAHVGCISDYLEDVADLSFLLPEHLLAKKDMTPEQTRGTIRLAAETLRGLNGLKVRLNMKNDRKKGAQREESAYVYIRAI